MAAYLEFFHLSQRPFTGTAHRRSAVATPPIRETAEQLHRLLGDEWPVLCVTGSPGIGKTHLALSLGSLIGDDVQLVRVESGLAWNEISKAASDTLGLPNDGLNAAELATLRAHGKRIVLLIDHAERLSDECLANLEALVLQKLPSDEQIVQCVLFARSPGGSHKGRGLHAWLEHLGAPEIGFDPLPSEAVSTYIERHLSWAGHDGPEIFTPDASEFLHAITGGIPEVLSRQCERLLEEAAAEDVHQIDRTFAARVFGRGDLTDSPQDREPETAQQAELEFLPEINEEVENREHESTDDDDLLSDLADGFLERLDAWEPGQPEPSPSAEAPAASPMAEAPVETAPATQASAVAETRAVTEADILPDAEDSPPQRGQRMALVAAAAIVAVAGVIAWQTGVFVREAVVVTEAAETQVESASPPPTSMALNAAPPASQAGNALLTEPAMAVSETLVDQPDEVKSDAELDATLLAQAIETAPPIADNEVAAEPAVEIVTAVTVDVRMRRRNPLTVERTTSDYEADF